MRAWARKYGKHKTEKRKQDTGNEKQQKNTQPSEHSIEQRRRTQGKNEQKVIKVRNKTSNKCKKAWKRQQNKIEGKWSQQET